MTQTRLAVGEPAIAKRRRDAPPPLLVRVVNALEPELPAVAEQPQEVPGAAAGVTSITSRTPAWTSVSIG